MRTARPSHAQKLLQSVVLPKATCIEQWTLCKVDKYVPVRHIDKKKKRIYKNVRSRVRDSVAAAQVKICLEFRPLLIVSSAESAKAIHVQRKFKPPSQTALWALSNKPKY